MGGIIGLTIRQSDGTEYRGSCWTNVLPHGLFDAPFYFPDESEAHTKEWLKAILEGRAADPQLEDIWGGWNKLAPVEYGLVIVDYKTSTLVACNGYYTPDHIWKFKGDTEQRLKWRALEKRGLLSPDPARPKDDVSEFAYIRLPFKNIIMGDSDACNKILQQWCQENFGLSTAEKKAWQEYRKNHA